MRNLEQDSKLGKKVTYDDHYNPAVLFPIARKEKRIEINIPTKLPFYGRDIWNHYEVSWLNNKGKPVVAMAEMSYDCASPFMIESKSMKLYFNSFNNTSFNHPTDIQNIIQQDLEERVGSPVLVRIFPLNDKNENNLLTSFQGVSLDELDIECTSYKVNSSYLITQNEIVEEEVYSNLLKSNCLVTNQPDWASVFIRYRGNKINHEGLLRYIVSFRKHNEFHEQCIERIFMDIKHFCQPEELTVYGRYTRRGGLDINPYRTTKKEHENISNVRLYRQ